MNLLELLNKYNCEFKAQINQYQESRLIDKVSFSFDNGDNKMKKEYRGVEWELSYNVVPAADRPDAIDVTVTFKVLKGQAFQSSVGVEFDFKDWSTDNYILIPGAVYNGNRFESRKINYPPLLLDTGEIMVDLPVTISDVPRLNINKGISQIQQTSQDPASPAIGFHVPRSRKGFWLLTHQRTEYGPYGIGIEESNDRQTAVISMTIPAVREYMYTIGNTKVPSTDCGADFKEGDAITINFRLYLFDSKDIYRLFEYFTHIRKDLTGPTRLYHGLPFSSAWEIQENTYNIERWYDEGGYYPVGLRETMNLDYQLGWVGGMIATYPLLFEGNKVSKQRALMNMQTFFTKTQAPSGFFYGIGDGKNFYSDAHLKPHPRNMHMIRRDSDALYYIIKQFMLISLFKEHGESLELPDDWIESIRHLVDVFVRLWKKYGQFGQFIDIETGDIIVGGSTSAAMASGGLALAGQYYSNEEYINIAKASALYFYERDVASGITTGGPGDILQCPDSESAFALLESFIVLYEVTGEQHWIDKACKMANICTSWCVSYDFEFPQESLFSKLGMHITGSVLASVQNKHSAPGICTMSGSALFKLFRATGNLLYLELAQEMSHNLTQYLSRSDRPIENMKPGWMSERINMSDWEGKDRAGETFEYPCWPEVSNMLTYVEVPGLYVQPDMGFVCAIDHIDVEFIKSDNSQLVVKVTNPTKFNANFKTFVENSTDTAKIMGQNALWGCKRIYLTPGESREIVFDKKRDEKLSTNYI